MTSYLNTWQNCLQNLFSSANYLIMFTFIDIQIPILNHVSREYLDPFILSVLRAAGFEQSMLLYLLGQFLVFFFGSLFFYREATRTFRSTLWYSLGSLLAIFSLSGPEVFFLKIQWFPCLCACLLSLHKRADWVNALSSFIAILFWCISAGALSLVGILFASVFVLLLGESRGGVEDQRKGSSVFSFSLILGIGVCLSFLFLVRYPLPDYPHNARLVPISFLTSLSHPLSGATLQLNTLLASQLSGLSRSAGFVCSCFLIIACILSFISRLSLRQFFSSVLLFVFALFLLFGVTGSCFAYSPMGILYSVVAGVALNLFPWTIASMLLVLGIFLLASNLNTGLSKWFAVSFLLVSAFSTLFSQYSEDFLRLGFTDHFARARDSAWNDKSSEIANSPSAFVLKTYGSWAADRRQQLFFQLSDAEPFACEDFTLQASINSEQVELACDGDRKTRWSTTRAQEVGDSFSIVFPQAVELWAIDFSLEGVPSDFPRGLDIYVGESEQSLRRVFSQADWQGELRWSDRGYPYFSSQNAIRVHFAHRNRAKFIKIVQTGTEPVFHWSIEEVELYGKRVERDSGKKR